MSDQTLTPLCVGRTDAGVECEQQAECKRCRLSALAISGLEFSVPVVRSMRDIYTGHCAGFVQDDGGE